MANIDVITTDGSKNGSVSLRKTKPASAIMISNNILANLANKRTARAHTKTRAEVSGGGKKPWKQKGTGQARAGSSRSPLWSGGGITFGPRSNRNFYKRVNKKQKLITLNDILTKSNEAGNLKVVEKIELPLGKTKEMIVFLSSIGVDGNTVLVLDKEFSIGNEAEKVYNAGRNISFLTITSLEKLNTFNLLKNKWIIFTKKAFEELNSRLGVLKESAQGGQGEKEVKKPVKKTVKKVSTKKEDK